MKRSRMVFTGCLSVLVIAMVLLNGCTLAPKYTRPAAPMPADWPTGEAYGKEAAAPGNRAAAEMKWEEFFTDPELRQVIAAALANNRDLRLASLNVEKARALYGIQRAELFPAFNAVGAGSKGRTPADLSYSGTETTYEQYSVNFGVMAWEIDFFGRIRSLKDRALEEYLATDQARRGAQILLVSAVANAYLNLAADRESLKLTTSTLAA